MEMFLGQITLFAGNFAPRGYQLCQGQILSIAQNTALFSILGTTYGGNGQTTFALPDLRGRVPTGTGQGPGLPVMTLGELAGTPSHALLQSEMPPHIHSGQVTAAGTTGDATDSLPGGKIFAAGGAYSSAASNSPMAPTPFTTGIAGSGLPHNNMQPYLGLNYIICVEGIFPSRN